MTTAEPNLKVVTDHLTRLADIQQHAADLFTGANRTTGEVAENVSRTHGLVCAATNMAVSTAETARKAAGEILHKRSVEMAAQLTTAATNYNDADYRAGRSLGGAIKA
ncbi:MAG: ESX-1 secretion-associated protein [Mycobacterium sp.]